jgi:hypothetical protein
MLDLAQPWELLAEETLVPVVFNTGATGLGKALNPGGSRQDIEPGDDLELPLWLVAPLQVRGAVSCKLPDVYRERYRQKLNAGAETVSFKNKVDKLDCPLHWLYSATAQYLPHWYSCMSRCLWQQAPYFYEVGIKLNQFLKDIDLSDFLTRTFRSRYQVRSCFALGWSSGHLLIVNRVALT